MYNLLAKNVVLIDQDFHSRGSHRLCPDFLHPIQEILYQLAHKPVRLGHLFPAVRGDLEPSMTCFENGHLVVVKQYLTQA